MRRTEDELFWGGCGTKPRRLVPRHTCRHLELVCNHLNNENVSSAADLATAKSHTLPQPPVESERRANLDFPVVGIGASAGGVEALTAFFRAASSESGMAFVVIQHLAPDSRSMMAEILSRCTIPAHRTSDKTAALVA